MSEQASNTRVGIGAYFQRSDSVADALQVKRILPNSPAAACKLMAVGDYIIAVDGELVSGKSLSQLAEKVLVWMIFGRVGGVVCLFVCACAWAWACDGISARSVSATYMCWCVCLNMCFCLRIISDQKKTDQDSVGRYLVRRIPW